MIRCIQLAVAVFLLSCSQKEPVEIGEWELSRIENIKHIEKKDQKIQVIYSKWKAGLLNFTDTSLVVQIYNDTLLLEEVEYNLEGNDTTKWTHHINRYNEAHQLIEEIDSIDGSLRNHSINFYKDNRLVRSKFLFIMPDYNDVMEVVGTDTTQSEILSYYDAQGRCVRVLSLNKDNLTSELTGTTKMDSTLTLYQFDSNNRKVGSLTLTNGDSTALSRIEYDQLGREKKVIDASLEFGATTFQYEYDNQGNITSVLMISDEYSELTKTKFDEKGRPVERKTYQPKTLANTM